MPPRKHPSKRQGHTTADLAVVQSIGDRSSMPAPEPDPGWLAATTRQWAALWSSTTAARIEPTDEPAVHRLFGWRDRQVRAERRAAAYRKEADKEPMVAGSRGQPAMNPLFAAADSASSEALQIETRIVALEDRLGLSPKARLALGLTELQGRNLLGTNEILARKITEATTTPDPRSTTRR